MVLTLSNLKPKIRKKPRKRVGRGLGSGRGAYSGRGIKGQKARTGGSIPPGFEGGRMPFIRQIPKAKGFKSIHPKSATITLTALAGSFAEGEVITLKSLKAKGFLDNKALAAKIVGKTKIFKKLNVQGVPASKSASTAIERAGGAIQSV
ncbi:MAG: 50S ribosomal protein L15 [Candidatus Doudnabacteria bacterium]|nr:50S ribosomal protein L15 [Candidatus Doudnabacteria bacterium]